MLFFAQKVLRKIAGNWTFVVVTDRQELDDQIYKTFAEAGAVIEPQVQARSGEHLRRLLGATVPLYYENRIPELRLTNENLNEDMARVIEELERELGREYHLITRNDRLEKIAEDIVAHFMGRGHRGKAMVVSID